MRSGHAPHTNRAGKAPYATLCRDDDDEPVRIHRRSNQAPLPSWAHELDGSRKVVLVTQGTVANYNFDLLVEHFFQPLGMAGAGDRHHEGPARQQPGGAELRRGAALGSGMCLEQFDVLSGVLISSMSR